MNIKKGPWTVLGSKIVYKNPWIKVKEEKVKGLNKKEGLFGVIEYGSGVSVVPIDKKNYIYLVKEYYYAIEEYGIQVPSGGRSKNESYLDAAKKELLEEAGMASEEWIELGFTNPLTMILRSPAHLFLALNVKVVQKQEEGIEIIKIPFEEAVDMVLKSKITHAPSALAILKAKHYLEKK